MIRGRSSLRQREAMQHPGRGLERPELGFVRRQTEAPQAVFLEQIDGSERVALSIDHRHDQRRGAMAADHEPAPAELQAIREATIVLGQLELTQRLALRTEEAHSGWGTSHIP